jgi:hypothetical protein
MGTATACQGNYFYRYVALSAPRLLVVLLLSHLLLLLLLQSQRA